MREYNNHPMHHPFWSALMLLLLLVPVLLLFAYFGLAGHAFRLLGLSSGGASALLAASLVGSVINIPLTRRRIVLADPRAEALPSPLQWLLPVVHYAPPVVAEEVIALNVGGAVVPIAFSLHLLSLATTSLPAAFGATAIVAAVAKLLARPMPGVGVSLPALVAPLVAAIAARELVQAFGGATGGAPPVAYIAGTLGTLIGADLLNLPGILAGRLLAPLPSGAMPGRQMLSIGGAGVFDGIFLAGILAPFLAAT